MAREHKSTTQAICSAPPETGTAARLPWSKPDYRVIALEKSESGTNSGGDLNSQS